MTEGGDTTSCAVSLLCKPVEQRNIKTRQLITSYPSASEAAQAIGVNHHGNIAKCCQNLIHSAYGYYWNYVGDEIVPYVTPSKNNKPVYMCDKMNHDNILKEFSGAKEASLFLNKTNGAHITAVCKGKLPSAYGYFWRYVNE